MGGDLWTYAFLTNHSTSFYVHLLCAGASVEETSLNTLPLPSHRKISSLVSDTIIDGEQQQQQQQHKQRQYSLDLLGSRGAGAPRFMPSDRIRKRDENSTTPASTQQPCAGFTVRISPLDIRTFLIFT